MWVGFVIAPLPYPTSLARISLVLYGFRMKKIGEVDERRILSLKVTP